MNRPDMKSYKWLWYAVFVPVGLVLVMLLLTAAGLFGRMPSFEELENPKSNLATEIYSEDGKVLGSFFVQNRSYVQYDDLFPADSLDRITLDGRPVPPIVAALISTEDARFRNHSGIDIPSLVRVAVKTVALQHASQGGGSTITQQLAKNLFPRDTVRNRGRLVKTSKLVLSKFKEWITALKLEYNYTKEEIATMYLNTVEYGSNAYGIKSAAQTFFGKEPGELSVQEAAMLVGVVNAPTRYSPVRNPEDALARRNLVLARMAAAGALTRAECDSISALPRMVEGVQAGLTLTENKNGTVRCSVRTTKEVDASAICRRCGGGGHLRAGGATFPAGVSLDEAKRRVLAAAEDAYNESGL